MKFIMLINVKMPMIVGILTLISSINTVVLKQEQSFLFQHFSFYEQTKFHAQLSIKKFYDVSAGLDATKITALT